MKILAVDPGYDRLGVAVVDCSEGVGRERLLYSDCVETNSGDSFPIRLRVVYESLKKIVAAYRPDVLVTESLYLASNKKTAIRVAETRGVILLAGVEVGLEVFEYSPPEIKMAVTGHGGSSKKQVEIMVKKLLSFPKKEARDDELDAVAIALTHSAMSRRNSLQA